MQAKGSEGRAGEVGEQSAWLRLQKGRLGRAEEQSSLTRVPTVIKSHREKSHSVYGDKTGTRAREEPTFGR